MGAQVRAAHRRGIPDLRRPRHPPRRLSVTSRRQCGSGERLVRKIGQEFLYSFPADGVPDTIDVLAPKGRWARAGEDQVRHTGGNSDTTASADDRLARILILHLALRVVQVGLGTQGDLAKTKIGARV